jgi:hypothetical protein
MKTYQRANMIRMFRVDLRPASLVDSNELPFSIAFPHCCIHYDTFGANYKAHKALG